MLNYALLAFFLGRGCMKGTVDDFSVEYLYVKQVNSLSKGVCLRIWGFWDMLVLINKSQTSLENSIVSLLNIQN